MVTCLQFAACEAGNATVNNFLNNRTSVHIAATAAVVPLYNLCLTRTSQLKTKTNPNISKKTD